MSNFLRYNMSVASALAVLPLPSTKGWILTNS